MCVFPYIYLCVHISLYVFAFVFVCTQPTGLPVFACGVLQWLRGGVLRALLHRGGDHLNFDCSSTILPPQFILMAHNIKWGSKDSLIYFCPGKQSSYRQCNERFKTLRFNHFKKDFSHLTLKTVKHPKTYR